jgi:vitamin B12 transporter
VYSLISSIAAAVMVFIAPAGVSLSGRITDAQGGAVAAANVRVGREDGTITRHGVTNASGEYRIDDLTPGVFIVEIERAGFRRRTEVVTLGSSASNVSNASNASNVLETASTTATFDVQLDVAGVDDTVVVTATGAPQVSQETSKPITIIDAQEIQARNEIALGDIIRFTPGVQIRNTGGPGQATSMRIRGLRSDAAAILVDGMRFRDASTAQADGTSFLQTLNFVGSERVEVLRGSGASLYGTNAVGGVINIVTRQGSGPIAGEGQAEGGSLGQSRVRGTVGGGALDNRLNFAAGLLRYDVRDGLDGNDAVHSTGAQGSVSYNVAPAANLSFRVYGSDDSVQNNTSPTTSGVPAANIPQQIIIDAIPVPPEQMALANQLLPFTIGSATYIPGRDDPDNLRTSAFYTTALRFRHSGWRAVSWQASYQRVHTGRTFTNGPRGAGSQPAVENYSNFIGDIDTVDVRGFASPRPWLSVTAGYEFEREGYRDKQDNFLPAPRRTQTETRISQQAHAAFASAQIGLFDRRLQLAASGRVQGYSLSNPELIALGTISPYDGVAVAAPDRTWTGDLSAAWLIARSNTKLRVHGGNAYRAPGLYERFGGGFTTDPVTGNALFSAWGDPRLDPDRYRAIDAGVDQYLFGNRLLVTTTAFYNDVRSLTAFDSAGGIRPDTDPYRRVSGYINSSGGFSRGVEVGAEARPTASLRLSAAYTYTRSETERDITIPGFFIVPNVFGHTATLVVTQRWTDRLDTTFDVFHGSDTYGSLSAAGRPRAYRYPGFTKAAVVAGYRFLDMGGRHPLRAYVKIDNLFDATYYENGWRNLGRTAVGGVSVGF